ncbi:serine-rich adhesin for platelets isoform X2 [Folsomia candida]|nr:serine-rich adhesin for platelets isoform X2 [Folsomia candida]
MASDVEEGEIRESECLSPLSDEDDDDPERQYGHKRRRMMRRSTDTRGRPPSSSSSSRQVDIRHQYRRRSSEHFTSRTRLKSGDGGINYKSSSTVSSSDNRNRSHCNNTRSKRNSNYDEKAHKYRKEAPGPSENGSSSLNFSNHSYRRRRASENIHSAIESEMRNSVSQMVENPLAKMQETRVIIYCDPPLSPDQTQVNSMNQEKNQLPQENIIEEEDNEVEVLSIIDKSSRIAELIVIDSTSSSESEEADTDFDDFNPDLLEHSLATVPSIIPVSPVQLSTSSMDDLSSNSVSLLDTATNLDLIVAKDSSTSSTRVSTPSLVDTSLHQVVEPSLSDQNELPPIVDTNEAEVENTSLVNISSEGDDEEDLEVLELRIKALKGLMQAFPSSQPLEHVTIINNVIQNDNVTHSESKLVDANLTHNSDGASQKQVDVAESTFSSAFADNNEKENEIELELDLLRRKLLSDLAKHKNKKQAAQEQQIKTRPTNNSSKSKSIKSRDRTTSRSSSARVSGNKKSSSNSTHRNNFTHSSSSAYRTRRSSISSIKASTSKSTSKSSTTSSALSSMNMSTISISVSKDGKHRTVVSREANVPTTIESPLAPIVIQSPSSTNPHRIVRLMEPAPLSINVQPNTTTPQQSTPTQETVKKSSSSSDAQNKRVNNKRGKSLSPIKRKQVTVSSSGVQKVLTKQNSSVKCSLSNKMTPFSHKSAVASKHTSLLPNNEFVIPRTPMKPNTFKSKYSSKKSYHQALDRMSAVGKKIQPIVIQLRNNDESTEEEDNDEDEELKNSSANLPQEFHSSLDKFLKSVRESATKNGVSGNLFQKNSTSNQAPVDTLMHKTLSPTNVNNNNTLPQSLTVRVETNATRKISNIVEDTGISRERNLEIPPLHGVQNVTSTSTNSASDLITVEQTNTSHSSASNSTSIIDDTNNSESSSSPQDNASASSSHGSADSPYQLKLSSPLISPVTPQNKVQSSPPKSKNIQQQVQETSTTTQIAKEVSFMEKVDAALRSQDDTTSSTSSNVKQAASPTSKNPGSTTSSITNGKSLKTRRKEANTGESLADQFTRTREELQLREKILRATFKKSEIKIKLTMTEKDFLTSRKSATHLLGCAIDTINLQSEKKVQCNRIEQQVEKLKKQLQVAERSLYVKKIEAAELHSDAVSTISKAFDMRAKSVTFGIECKKLGSELSGDLYKIPSMGAGDMLTKFKEIYKLTTNDELKKGPINFKKLEEQIITSLEGHKVAEPTTPCSDIRSSLASTKNIPDKNSQTSARETGGFIAGCLTRHCLAPDRHVTFTDTPLPATLMVTLDAEHNGKFVPYVSCLINSIVLSKFNCRGIVCPHIVNSNCNSKNCKFQHIPISPRSTR